MLLAHKGINTIHIYGYGLEDYDLKKLSGQELVFHPAIAPIGFSRVQYKNELMQGETMELQGSFHQSDSAKTTILLMGFGSVLDSTHLDEQHLFTLRYIPAQIGVATYSLIALRGSDTLEKQILPVNVSEHQPLRVLMLGSAPGFEGRFLKDWLSRKGYRVMSRTRVNKKIYARDFVNEEREMADAIGSSLLDQADMVVADNGALASLSATEIRTIKTAIREKGLGLLICVNGDESIAATGIAYRVNRSPGGIQQKLDLRLNDGRKLKPLITEDQYDIVPGDQFLPLVQNESGKLFSAAGMEGKGRIVLNTINYSYKWMLSGSESDYDHFWMNLVVYDPGTCCRGELADHTRVASGGRADDRDSRNGTGKSYRVHSRTESVPAGKSAISGSVAGKVLAAHNGLAQVKENGRDRTVIFCV